MTYTIRLSTALPPASTPDARLLLRRTAGMWVFGLCAGVLSPAALAVSLGEATTRSAIGEMLRIEVPLRASADEQIDLSCIRLMPQPADDMSDAPWVTRGSLRLQPGTDGQQTLVITAQPVRHPVAMLSVAINCGTSLRRDYALLLEAPRVAGATAVATPVAPPLDTRPLPAASGIDSAGKWVVAPGQSPASIARALYPQQRSVQQRFLTALYAANPSLGAHIPDMALAVGTELNIPKLPGTSTVSAEPRPPKAAPAAQPVAPRAPAEITRKAPSEVLAQPTGEAAPPKKEKSRAAAPRDHLIVSDSTEGALRLSKSIDQRAELSEAQRSSLKTELELIADLDEKNVEHLELKDRLRRLESLQARLAAEARRLEAELAALPEAAGGAPAVAQSTPPAQVTPPPVAQASAATPSVVTLPAPIVAETTPQEPAWWQRWQVWLAAALLAGAGLSAGAVVLVRRRQNELDELEFTEEPPQADADFAMPEIAAGDPMMEPLTEADIWPDEPASSEQAARTVEGALGPLTTMGESGPATQTPGEEEYDSAVELADIMMSFGRVQGAAQTLADYIRVNPKQAVKPWIKLLEVYRAANMRIEFEGLTAQLNKTFNVQPVSWEDFDAAMRAPDTLGNMPHIAEKLCELWGQRACQAYLHELLRDNRKGTRQGFPLIIIDEILLLLAILEASLGTYRPDLPEGESEAAPPAASPLLAENSAKPSFEHPTISLPSPRLPDSANPASPASVADFDFDMLDMDLLSKTLHINLDELAEPSSEPTTTHSASR